jgi:hypothetical protein
VHDRKHRSNDAMILPHDANRRRIKFSERTGNRSCARRGQKRDEVRHFCWLCRFYRFASAFPLWVTSGSRSAFPILPLFPRQQTSLGAVGTSV